MLTSVFYNAKVKTLKQSGIIMKNAIQPIRTNKLNQRLLRRAENSVSLSNGTMSSIGYLGMLRQDKTQPKNIFAMIFTKLFHKKPPQNSCVVTPQMAEVRKQEVIKYFTKQS